MYTEEEFEKYAAEFYDKIAVFLPELVAAFIILIVGLLVIRITMKLVNKVFTLREVDKTVSGFLTNLLRWGLRVFLFIIVVSKLGIQTTSFVAILGAAGLAVGMALQGSLSNFAGGVLIVLFKPFKVGDYINAQGTFGTVLEISIFTTTLATDTNQRAIIPNGQLSNQKMINYSTLPYRREMMNIGIGYDDDIRQAKEVILKLADAHPLIEREEKPVPAVMVSELGDSSVVLQLRYWTKTSDFWGVHWEMLENIKYALDEAGISIPYPQSDVHLFNNNAEK